ncbi:mevalonate kinase [Candidatus Gottesmanbacteria bacterium]|nr:mevalonate kinase [Candidatus Gottesmanbacteria bacterium]
MVIVSVPGKLIGEHAVVYGYPCIVSSVDKYLTVKGGRSFDKNDTFVTGKIRDTSFIKSAIDIIRNKYKLKERIFLETESDLGEYGLGSSAAVTVATVKLLNELFGLSLTNQEAFELSYKAVLQAQKKASGFDTASCIFGGTIYFDGKSKKIDVLSHDLLPIIVGFSGNKGDTMIMIEKVAELKKKKQKLVEEIFNSIGKLVGQGKRAICKKDWQRLGKLMNDDHQLLIKLGVSNNKLNQLVGEAVRAGAYGAKLSGAGGGDCMIALVSDENRAKVEAAIRNAGGELINVEVGKGTLINY